MKVTQPAQALLSIVDKAISISDPEIEAQIARIRRSDPDMTPEELIGKLENYFLATVAGCGAAAGAAGAAPGVGVIVVAGLAGGDIVLTTTAAAAYALAVAKVHGVDISDLERRRTLVLGLALGQAGEEIVRKGSARAGAHWGKNIVNAIPPQKLLQINKVLGRNFVTKYGTKQGIIVLGKMTPFGVGAALGAAGNTLVGRGIVQATRRAFGPPPAEFATTVTVVRPSKSDAAGSAA